MLNGIHLVDYGNHRDTRLTFGRMTALVGQNGSGKTNLLRGIAKVGEKLFSDKDEENPSEHSKDEDALNRDEYGNVKRGAIEWLISANWLGSLSMANDREQQGNWAVRIGSQKEPIWLWRPGPANGEDWIPHPQETWEDISAWAYWPSDYWKGLGILSGEIESGTTVRAVSNSLNAVWVSQYFKTAGNYLQEPSYSKRSTPTLSEDCHDLAWMIAYLKGDKDEAFASITEALRKVVPTFRRVKHRPVPIRLLERKDLVINQVPRSYDEEHTVMGQELRFDMASGTDLPATAISEGTLITLAILTAIMHDNDLPKEIGTKTILLDDIESGLHPSAQRDLIRQLRLLQEARPELQIIFSSHSPYVIDEMQPEDVWLFAPDKEGVAHCAKLSDHPDAKRALEVLTTGEFWSAEGESWVLDRAKQVTRSSLINTGAAKS